MNDLEKVLQILNKRSCDGWTCVYCPIKICNANVGCMGTHYDHEKSAKLCHNWLKENAPESIYKWGTHA